MNFDQQIFNTAINNGLPQAVATNLVAQARLESSNYSSNIFLNNNNSFGYKYVGQSLAVPGDLAPRSEWTDPGTPQYYAKYSSVEDSAQEVINWIFRRIKEGIFTMEDLATPQGYANSFKKADYFGESAFAYGRDLTSILKNALSNGLNFVKNNPIVSLLIIFAIFGILNKKV